MAYLFNPEIYYQSFLPAPVPPSALEKIRVSLMILLEQGDRLDGGKEGKQQEEEVVGMELEKEKI